MKPTTPPDACQVFFNKKNKKGLTPSTIPAELQALPSWVAWMESPNPDPDKKPVKLPVDAKNGRLAKTTDATTWADFETVRAFLGHHLGQEFKAGGSVGIIQGPGFVFTPDDPFCGVDLDNCLYDGNLEPWAEKIVNQFASYTEVSHSGKGLHIIIEGRKPAGAGCKRGDIECYDQGRYFAVTGTLYNGSGPTVNARQSELDAFLAERFGDKPKPQKTKPAVSSMPVNPETVLNRARKGKNGGTIDALLSGNGGHASESEADLAVCNHLAFYCGHIGDGDAFRIIDAIIRQSGRYREKWDKKHFSTGETYGQHTINKALAATVNRWQARHERVLAETAGLADDFTPYELENAAYSGQKGAAELFTKKNQGRFVYDHSDGNWYEFRGHHWRAEAIGRPIKELDEIQAAFERQLATVEGEVILKSQELQGTTDATEREKIKSEVDRLEGKKKAFRSAIRSLDTLGFRKNVVEFSAQGADSLGISGDEWDLLPWALAVKNGIINLKNGELRPGRPGDYIKSSCPVEYDDAATCPRFERFLMEIFGDDLELIYFMQRLLGMSLVGVNLEHILAIWYGKGRNGKDIFISILCHALGPDLAGAVQSELLLDQGRIKSSSGPSADIMRLRGLRLAHASETNEGRRMDAGKIKLLTGGGDLVGRAPFARREVAFPQSFTLFLLTNAKPTAAADDYALWKRIKLIPFNMQFVDDPQAPNERQRDKDLLEKLKPEAPGILAWLVQGCLEWQKIGLKPPAIVDQATLQYRDENDLLLTFQDEACLTGPDYQAGATALYNQYRQWMTDNGLRPMSGQKFGRKMADRFHKEKKMSGWQYLGIGIIENG